jgi:hypothetical protein
MQSKKRNLWSAAGLSLVLACLAVVPQANATTMIYRSIEELAQRSAMVVEGTVSSAETYAGDEGRITTRWTVKVARTLRGQPAAEVRLEQWAGTLGDITTQIPGDARFTEGERVVLFLRGDSPDKMYLTAMGQAKFTIYGGNGPAKLLRKAAIEGAGQGILPLPLKELAPVAAPQSRTEEAVRDLSDIAFAPAQPGAAPLFFVHGVERLSLSELESRVFNSNLSQEVAP